MNIFHKLHSDLRLSIIKLFGINSESLDTKITVESPKDILNGDIATNAAMILATKLQLNTREIAVELKKDLINLHYVSHIEIAGPGFINFTIKAEEWHKSLLEIIFNGLNYNQCNTGNGSKINIEYVSANPTGPIHIGHTRCAVYGDVLSRLFTNCGYSVTKEFYVNDVGSQIKDLTEVVFLRYEALILDKEVVIPSGLYPGKYLISVAQDLVKKYGNSLLSKPREERENIIKDYTVNSMLDLIKRDLADLGIHHDVYFFEHKLHESKEIDLVVNDLQQQGIIYKGVLSNPKGIDSEDWINKEKLIFKSSMFGDDQDRSLQKINEDWSYFAADIAYQKNKIERGFDNIIIVLGADHIGYVKRTKAIFNCLNKNQKNDIKICQLVNYIENETPIKMSKRAGNFTTLKDVLHAVDKDIIRFMMLTRKNDAPLDFDLIKVKEQSKDNLVFYVQYAYVRAKSILDNAKNNFSASYNLLQDKEKLINIIHLLNQENEIQLIKTLATWPKIVDSALLHLEPHRIAFYLINIASIFHNMWSLRKQDNQYRFIVNDNIELTTGRLCLVSAIIIIIELGFDIIGITPMEKM